FKLSLRGFDPAADYIQLTRDVLGRRTDRQRPETSLMLQKALGRVPHEGGSRFLPGSAPGLAMRGWLAEGLQDDPPALPALKGFAWTNPPEANYVDKLVFAKLKMLSIPPSDLCTDQEFVRRAYLDLCGVLPNAEEVRTFLADGRADKRPRLIDALLERPEYAD